MHFNATFSPDGRWLAYTSLEGERGTGAIFVEPFPRTGAKYQVSSTLSDSPRWSPDGKQILYSDGPLTGRLMAVEVRTRASLSFGNPMPILTPGIDKPPTTWRPYDLTPDGRRILMVVQPAVDVRGAAVRRQINVVLNWQEELKQRLPTPRHQPAKTMNAAGMLPSFDPDLKNSSSACALGELG